MQTNLLKISLIISFLGILLLLLISNLSQPKVINSYQELNLNKHVSVQGKILSINQYGEFKIIKLDNNITITCDSCNLKQNQTIFVQGKVAEYKGEKQILVSIIKNVN